MGKIYGVLSIHEVMQVKYLTVPTPNMWLTNGQCYGDYGIAHGGAPENHPAPTCLAGGHRFLHPLALKARISVLVLQSCCGLSIYPLVNNSHSMPNTVCSLVPRGGSEQGIVSLFDMIFQETV